MVLLALAGCGQDTADPAASTVTETVPATVTAPAPAAVTETVTVAEPEPEPEEPEPEPEGEEVEGVPLGEAMEFPSASVTINSAERRDSITSDTGSITITPGDRESLWVLSMEWTNLSEEAVSKVCHGPYTVEVEVYDTQDRQLLRNDESGHIPGNECSDGLLTGQSGKWFLAYTGLEDAEIGYIAVAEGYDERPQVVILDDSVSLSWND